MSNLARRIGFWSGPGSRHALARQLDESQLLRALWAKHQNSAVNATTTLPLEIPSKDQTYKSVEAATGAKGLTLKTKQFFAFGKAILGFYKAGVSNVWKNNREMKVLRSQKFSVPRQVRSSGKDVTTQLPRFPELVDTMAQILYNSKVEHKALNEQVDGQVVKDGNKNIIVEANIFALHRNQFQLLKRTPKDFVKIPAFVVILAIFMETTPLLCLAFPEVTPSTCALPSLLPRLWNSGANKRVQGHARKYLEESNAESLASKTAYNLPVQLVRDLGRSLRLTSKYLPIWVFPEPVLRRRLQSYYNYLTVDNYYLSGLNGDGNVFNLSRAELLQACLERNLVLDLKQELSALNSTNESEKRSLEEEFYISLRTRLVRFVIDFENYNIGYVALNGLLPKLDIARLI